ncbi:protein FAR-RED IMPAIRED RESPONSE 1-like [Camellia sinensis]|uniref:protein FAR-RED IMPAIRED RESPONSE 1-like n=1 Tax=Camellia sinensis TaxID=4442 RepID=UPI0010361931|nr:protein FAR-RED IMPAIRED RESPONSE 1-like [Camellia sinensis]
MEEVSSGSESVGLNEDHNEIEIEKAKSVEDPKVGMLFDSIDDLVQFYQRYAKEKGFGMCIRSSKKVGGEVRYVIVACTHSGKPKIKSSKLHQLHPQSKTDCKAKICANLLGDGKWILRSMVLDHNHGVSPGKARFYRCHRVLNSAVKRRLELHAKVGIRMNKSFNSLVVQAGGHEKLTYLEKDCRNHMDRVKRIELGEGDATTMHNYFLKMQADNSEFFHMMDLDEEGRLRNVSWADARSRAAFKEFGDVVTFDTTYLVNKYAMPFAHFVGVNHHGQSTLLGYGLISGEDTETFTWLFQSWLTCMSGCPSFAIITDQDQAMKNAIEVVFHNARHRGCLWHIMKKLPEKLRGYNQYEGIKFSMKNVVYDSLTIGEFEESWGKFIEKYKLQSNKWLFNLYDERHHWVPAFVKDTFWAGMSTTQRSESMHAFFDGYVNSKTTLKQFVEQYENALAKKVENENNEEFNSFNSCIPCMVGYEMEKQLQSAYTTEKFKEFQRELMGKISCDLSSYKKDAYISKYEVAEDILFGESRRRVSFNVCFDEDTNGVYCNCRLFEYRGILCRHQIVVFIHRKVDQIPDKYILKRWSKNVKMSHTKVRISYDNWALKPEARRFDKMCNVFYEVVDLAAVSEDWSEKFIERICEFRVCMKQDSCRSDKQISELQDNGNMHGARVVELVKEENIHFHVIIIQLHLGGLDLEMGGVMHPNNFNGMLTMNDMAQAKTLTLHKDDKSEEH